MFGEKRKKGIRRVWLYFVGHKIYFYEKRLQYSMLVDSFIPFLTFTNVWLQIGGSFRIGDRLFLV